MPNSIIETGIDGCVIALMPAFEKNGGGVFHILPGGSGNADWYDGDILDVYGFFSNEPHALRGGHYHPVLNEMFCTVSGTALWILSDFRPSSPTFQKTLAVILGKKKSLDAHGVPSYTVEETNQYARLKVPAGVYHAIVPLSADGFTTIALGTTPYTTEDYRHPAIHDVPGMHTILTTFSITPA